MPDLRRNNWHFTILTPPSWLILYRVDGANRAQHRERSNVILRNSMEVATFKKCLSDSYLRLLHLFPLQAQETTWTCQVIAFGLACDGLEGLGYFQMQMQYDNIKPE